jgi:hypothetical protein
MHLVQLFLPLPDKAGAPFPPAAYDAPRTERIDALAGAAAYPRAPATGLREGGNDVVRRDHRVPPDAMIETLARDGCRRYAAGLAGRSCRREILVEELPCEWP